MGYNSETNRYEVSVYEFLDDLMAPIQALKDMIESGAKQSVDFESLSLNVLLETVLNKFDTSLKERADWLSEQLGHRLVSMEHTYYSNSYSKDWLLVDAKQKD